MSDPATILASLPIKELESLAEALEGQWLSIESSRPAIAKIAGGAAESIHIAFQDLKHTAFTSAHVTMLLRVALTAKKTESDKQTVADLVISGPDVPGIPTAATEAVVQTLFQEAKSEIIMAGYAFYNTKTILKRLSDRMLENPNLKVILHVDVSRTYRDTSTDEAIVARYAIEFRRKHWPWEPKPEIYYDPRAMSKDASERACLHAKVVVVDRAKLLITSANFTEAAQKRNIEIGALLTSTMRANQLADYFEGLRKLGLVKPLIW